ncbi:MAG: DNA-processing protein DprA, partial [Acetobacteraceae bacterium]
RGSNDLLRQGAHVTETAADVLDNLPDHPLREGLARDPLFARPSATKPEPLARPDPMERGADAPSDLVSARDQIANLLSPAATAVDDLVRRCQLSPAAVMAVLLELELAGRIEHLPGHRVALLP